MYKRQLFKVKVFCICEEQIDSRTSTGIDGNKFLTSNETNFAFSGKCTFFILLSNCKVFLTAYFGLKLIYFVNNH